MAQTRETVREHDIAEARKKVEDLEAKRAQIDQDIAEASKLIRAWEAFDLAMQGKLTLPGEAAHAMPKASKATGLRGKPGELSGFRKEVYDYVKQVPKGRETSEVQAHFKAEKKPAAISAALFNLKKQGHLSQAGDRSPYIAAERQAEPAATTPRVEAPTLAGQEAE